MLESINNYTLKKKKRSNFSYACRISDRSWKKPVFTDFTLYRFVAWMTLKENTSNVFQILNGIVWAKSCLNNTPPKWFQGEHLLLTCKTNSTSVCLQRRDDFAPLCVAWLSPFAFKLPLQLLTPLRKLFPCVRECICFEVLFRWEQTNAPVWSKWNRRGGICKEQHPFTWVLGLILSVDAVIFQSGAVSTWWSTDTLLHLFHGFPLGYISNVWL